jgi:hypothetical protein
VDAGPRASQTGCVAHDDWTSRQLRLDRVDHGAHSGPRGPHLCVIRVHPDRA